MELANTTILPGQRWVSDSEPELGLGMILRVEHQSADIVFPAVQESRCYALESAPLRRVKFSIGEWITTTDEKEIQIATITEEEGLLIYHDEGGISVAEAQLSDSMSFYSPLDRLYACQIDTPRTFKLRLEAVYRNYALKRSPVRGYTGARADLIPHQLSIVSELCKRIHPRALLADEVGLGKTIEACMVMHQMHLTGRADRVLIVLPEPLVNQWFVELLRRFNLLFSIFDEERCASLEKADPSSNPFDDSQLVITHLDFLLTYPKRIAQLRSTDWDLLIMDEVHHLEWSPEESSESYQLAESLCQQIHSVLLLSATPQQLGVESHFARLKLLDPERFSNLQDFIEESQHYEDIATIIGDIQDEAPLSKTTSTWLEQHLPETKISSQTLEATEQQELTDKLLDRFGAGRVMFRNTRSHLSGFPQRIPHFHPLVGDLWESKTNWLVKFLKTHPNEKILLITKLQSSVEALIDELPHRIKIDVAAFHEGLSLNQRDRNAAFFAKEEGAQILICSEIGSEGRNFQFVHHLVLFDLPENPELLEQRIGRLDRIGQTSDINIHIPFIEQSYHANLAHWYHEGLNAFSQNVHGADTIFHSIQDQWLAHQASPDQTTLKKLVVTTKRVREEVAAKLSSGYDKLLELQSHRLGQADKIASLITATDADENFEKFQLRLWDHYRLEVDELGDRSYFLKPGNVITDAFPAIPEHGLSVTFDRSSALSREDIGFLSTDHPIARASFDLLLGSESGNASFSHWKNSGDKALLLEALFILEPLAPSHLHVDRFMPPTPIRVVVDHKGNNLSADPSILKLQLPTGTIRKLMNVPSLKQEKIPELKEAAAKIANKSIASIQQKATAALTKELQPEIDRLELLASQNHLIREREVSTMKNEMAQLEKAIAQSRLRLDAVHLIWKD